MAAHNTSTSDTKTLLDVTSDADESFTDGTSTTDVKPNKTDTNKSAGDNDVKVVTKETEMEDLKDGENKADDVEKDGDVVNKSKNKDGNNVNHDENHDLTKDDTNDNIKDATHDEIHDATTEQTALLSEGEDEVDRTAKDITMATEEDYDERVEDMTRSLLALESCGDGSLEPTRRLGFKRYSEALKGALPVRFGKGPKTELPVARAGFFSQMTFSWQTSMMWKIYRKGIDCIQNMDISPREKSKPNIERLERIWEEEYIRHGPDVSSFYRSVVLFIRTRMIVALLCVMLSVCAQFAVPAFVLHKLLSYLASGNMTMEVGIVLVVVMTCMELVRSLTFALSWHYNYTTGVRVRAAVMGLLYKKVLKLRNLGDKSVGELVNLMGNDAQRIFEACVIGPLMLPGPVVLVMGLIYMLLLVGPWSLIAMGIFFAFYPFMVFISKLTNYYRRKCIVITDKRVRMMNELLTCIKLIKMYAWEKSFAKAIAAIRADERKILEKGAYVQSISSCTAPIVPVMASVFTFLAFVLTGNELTPVIAFTIIAVLNSMRFSLGVLPFAVKAIADAKVSFKRYKSILLMDDMTPHKWMVFNDKYALVLNKAAFRWEREQASQQNGQDSKGNTKKPSAEKIALKSGEQVNGTATFTDSPTLQDITFTMEKGKLVGICGSVGCGKSSLLSAVLGRMIHVSGKIALQGTVAYVAQQAWITNTTVRENILFGEEYDPVRYGQVVEACSLLEDFSAFANGDQTEIGERGINLSGGQKQRISLARAVYSDKDMYLLDDPLSAVDIHIGRHIFSECIMKQLNGKTVLFVTHQLQYLSKCDRVLFMRDGMVTDSGTHSELMKGDTEYAALIKMFYTKEKEKEGSLDSLAGRPRSIHKQFSVERPELMRQRTLSGGSSTEHGSPRSPRKIPKDLLRQFSVMSEDSVNMSDNEDDDNADKPKKEGKLIVTEEKKEGKIGWPVYRTYMKAAGGYVVSGLVMLMFFIAIASQSFTNWWLSHWLNQGSGNTTITVGNVSYISQSINDHPDLMFYTGVYGGSVIFIIISTALRAFLFMKVTLRASSNLHNGIFHNMISSPMKFFDTTPVGRIINRFSSDLDEIDVRLPSTSEMFIQNMFLIMFALALISYVSPWFLLALIPFIVFFILLNIVFTSGVRELMRMYLITRSPVVSHVTATVQGISTIHAYGKTEQFLTKFNKLLDHNSTYFYLFCCANRWLAFRLDLISSFVVGLTGLLIVLTYDNITPAMAGLALSFSIQMTGLFQFTIRQAIETEAKFVAVQRLQHYSEDIETEAPAIIPENRPPADWPKPGEITFDRYKMRYRDNLPLALKGLKFSIRAKEKIGIVGRSGSGKSSLGVALFRLVEPASGTIYIDGIDITSIGLEDLRSRLAIIPQDPVLFVGTVRYNLDPFGQHQDNDLWSALEKCHVKDTIQSLELKLDHLVVENGENFSVGERQLICMSRALLRHSKILMLDEATAAIDTETDALVQKTIKEAFVDCTMLIIAHRLNTVIGCDRILVMEDGLVVEYGRPKDLMMSSSSKFKAMLEAVEKQQETMDT